jgi:hypothetical protein
MDDIDISRERLELLHGMGCADYIHLALRAALDRAEDEINTKADFINDLLNKMAQAEEAHQAALNAPNRHAYKVGIAVGKAQAEARTAAAVDAMREAAIDARKAIWSDVVEDMAEFGLEHPAQAEIDAIRAIPTPPALPASPLEAVAMRDAALKAIMDIWAELWPKMAELELQHPAQPEIDAICAIPLPDHAAMLAAALKLPEVAALVDAAMGVIARWDSPDWKSSEYEMIGMAKLRTALAPFTGAKP